jgi:hypothetical protein
MKSLGFIHGFVDKSIGLDFVPESTEERELFGAIMTEKLQVGHLKLVIIKDKDEVKGFALTFHCKPKEK